MCRPTLWLVRSTVPLDAEVQLMKEYPDTAQRKKSGESLWTAVRERHPHTCGAPECDALICHERPPSRAVGGLRRTAARSKSGRHILCNEFVTRLVSCVRPGRRLARPSTATGRVRDTRDGCDPPQPTAIAGPESPPHHTPVWRASVRISYPRRAAVLSSSPPPRPGRARRRCRHRDGHAGARPSPTRVDWVHAWPLMEGSLPWTTANEAAVASPGFADDELAALNGLSADVLGAEASVWPPPSPYFFPVVQHAATAAAAELSRRDMPAGAMGASDGLFGGGGFGQDGLDGGGGGGKERSGMPARMHTPAQLEQMWNASAARGYDGGAGAASAANFAAAKPSPGGVAGFASTGAGGQHMGNGADAAVLEEHDANGPDTVGRTADHDGADEEDEADEAEPDLKPPVGGGSEGSSLQWAPFGLQVLPASESSSAHGHAEPRAASAAGEKRATKCSYGSDVGFTCVGNFSPALMPRISLSRSLIRSADGGVHRWNKSWLFPEITVRLPPGPAAAAAAAVQVFVVTSPSNPSSDGGDGGQQGASAVENAGLGTSDTSRIVRPCRPQQVVNGEAVFTRLRLRATSYTLGGRRFSLVVVVLDHRGCIIASVASSPFLVHARIDGAPPRCRWSTPRTLRSSRSGAYHFSAFDVDTFTRVYVKKSSTKGGGAAATFEEPIDNSAVGLLRYFTAPNIRNKSRHPLLLVVRFSNALILSRDVERYPTFDTDAASAFIAACGTVLPNGVHGESTTRGLETTPLVPWILSLRAPPSGDSTAADGQDPNALAQSRAVLRLRDMLGNLRGPAVGWVADATVLPPRYSETTDTDLMRSVYTRLRVLADATGGVPNGAAAPRASSGSHKRPLSGTASAGNSTDDRRGPRRPRSAAAAGEATLSEGSSSRAGYATDDNPKASKIPVRPRFAPGPFPKATVADGAGGYMSSNSRADTNKLEDLVTDRPTAIGASRTSAAEFSMQDVTYNHGVRAVAGHPVQTPHQSKGENGVPAGMASVTAPVATTPDGMPQGSEFNPQLRIHASFDHVFRSLHVQLNGVADALHEEAVAAFPRGVSDSGRGLRIALCAMKAALRGHHVEEKLLYDALRSRTPGVCESYVIDQLRSMERLDELDVLIRSLAMSPKVGAAGAACNAPASPAGRAGGLPPVEPVQRPPRAAEGGNNPTHSADLFMKVSHFTRLLADKSSKEEDHLLPYFFRMFSLKELTNLLNVMQGAAADAVAKEREAAASGSHSVERTYMNISYS